VASRPGPCDVFTAIGTLDVRLMAWPARAGAVTVGALEPGPPAYGERGQPTGGSAAPGGLPPAGRSMLPPRSRRGPLLPSALALAVPLRSSSRFPRLTSAFCARPRPGPARPGAPEACP